MRIWHHGRITSTPTIRSAHLNDLEPRTAYLLWQLRSAVFVVEQDCAYLDLDGRDLEPSAVQLWAEQDGTPVGTLRILHEPDGTTLRIGRVVVAPDQRGNGLAADLVRAALAQVGEQRCVLDAQAHLEHWYARFGFTASGEPFLEDGIPHVPMTRG